MAAVLVRIALLAAGIGLGEVGLESFAHGGGEAVIELLFAVLLLVAGSAGFMTPLLYGRGTKEISRDV